MLKLLKKNLEKARESRVKRLIVRPRVAWHEQGERCTKYFLSLEKRNAMRKSVQYLKVNDKVIANKHEILNIFTEHFATKYTATKSMLKMKEYLHGLTLTKLSYEQKQQLDMPLSLQELTSAIMKMKKGKSPGSNGFTSSFFKQFWSHLGIFLLRAFNDSICKDKLISSHREGIITLIPKPGKPSYVVKSWRPISLLNVDFKIISSVIAERLKSIMNVLIAPQQSAYLKGRYIGENSRLVYDIIESLNHEHRSGLIIAADFEAAFESVSWNYLMCTLDAYNFGPYITNLIKLMYVHTLTTTTTRVFCWMFFRGQNQSLSWNQTRRSCFGIFI